MSRLYVDTNFTPYQVTSANPATNSPVQLYARKKPGIEPALVAYAGTLNRAPTWSNAAGVLQQRGSPGTGPEANCSDPIDPRAARAITNLALHPGTFGTDADPIRPVFIDLESGKLGQSTSADKNARRTMYQGYLDAIKVMRAVNYNVPIYIYGYPWGQSDVLGGPHHTDDVEDLDHALAGAVNGLVCMAYNVDADAISGGTTWFDRVQSFDRLASVRYPGLPKVAFVTPQQSIYWPQNFTGDWAKYAQSAGKPVPLDLWRRQNQYLIERGYDRFLWLGNLWDEATYKSHVDAI